MDSVEASWQAGGWGGVGGIGGIGIGSCDGRQGKRAGIGGSGVHGFLATGVIKLLELSGGRGVGLGCSAAFSVHARR